MGVVDAIYGPAKILAIVITLFVGIYVWTSFLTVSTDSLRPTMDVDGQAALDEATGNVSIGLTTIDYMMPLIVFGLLIVSLIFAFKTGASVIYAVLSISVWVLALILSSIFTNVYLQVNETLDLGGTYIISNFIMTNLKWIVLGWLALVTIAIFSQNKKESGGLSAAETVFN